MLAVDHDKNILLSTPFPTIPMLGTNCWCNVIVFYVGNKRCCIVLYCIVLYCIVLYCIVLYCIVRRALEVVRKSVQRVERRGPEFPGNTITYALFGNGISDRMPTTQATNKRRVNVQGKYKEGK